MNPSELRAKRAALESLWQEGLSGQALLAKHTELIDSNLSHSFKNCPADTSEMALVALGGYGRQELFPFSDIDLMILYRDCSDDEIKSAAEAIFYPLWDAGLEVGHGVRNKEICLDDAEADFFFQVALLDARLLAGNNEIFTDLMAEFHTTFVHSQRKEFFEKMVSHCRLRHERFGNHSYLLEPHIKESRGGFRDLQAMLWSAKVVFGIDSLEELGNSALISQADQQNLEEASNNLIRIRNRLHYISGRKNDQLFFEHQEEMAEAFSYRTSKAMLGVELFMRDLHNSLQTIAVATELFFEHVTDVVGLTRPEKGDKKLEQGLAIRQGRIQLTAPELLTSRPHLMMRTFSQASATGLPIHHRTKKLISDNLELLNDNQRHSKRMAKAFLDTLQAGKPLTVLTDMLETGLLSAFIPEFEHLESLAQHDIYHVYTVDRHLLQSVAELNLLAQEESAIFNGLSSPLILLLAGLIHDIGKGTNQDHSEYGSELALVIGKRLGLPENERDDLAFLVRHHLYLTDTALRRDIEDEGLIRQCAKKIQEPERLAMLYLLSMADARATGPTVWTEWKGALLQGLYLKVAHVLEHKEMAPPDQKQAGHWMRDQIAQMMGGSTFDLATLPDDYLLNLPAAEVANHIRLRQEALPERTTILEPCDMDDHWQLLLMAQDRPGLLSRFCGVLALHNIKVLGARIFTWNDGTVVDVVDVTSAVGNQFDDQEWQRLQADLDLALNFQLGIRHRLSKKIQPPGRKPKLRTIKHPHSRVTIEPDGSDNYTIVEVFSEDRPVLLYNITCALLDFGLSVYRAQIGSQADQVVDVFYVLDHQGNKIHDPQFIEEIRQGLIFAAS
ncbi:MAG: [protein-PII] uridylyltransferase [Thermodesulfobacteriota bacterium]